MTLLIGTRGSDLALFQSNWVKNQFMAKHSACAIQLKIITTRGDVSLANHLAGTLEKGFFTKELEDALLQHAIHLAVHSLKDLPVHMPVEFSLPAILNRHEPQDILLALPHAIDNSLSAAHPHRLPLKPGVRVGTSSFRRIELIRHYAQEALPVPLRGNVNTRLKKLYAGEYDAIVLARAGVERLGLQTDGLVKLILDARCWPPAPGQGAIAVQTLRSNEALNVQLASLHDLNTAIAVHTERAFLSALAGGCSTPFGCYVEDSYAYVAWLRKTGFILGRLPLPQAQDAMTINTALATLQPLEMIHDFPLYQAI